MRGEAGVSSISLAWETGWSLTAATTLNTPYSYSVLRTNANFVARAIEHFL